VIKGKKVLALIPARGGSKGLPGKNIRLFCGKPLLAHTIDLAKQSKYIDKIVVSTDCEKIARIATEYNAKPFTRPPHLSTDTALVADAIKDLMCRIEEKFDTLVLLEATSPLRTVELVDQCIEQITTQEIDSIATFSHADPPPTRLWNIEENVASPFLSEANPWLPRQQQQGAYFLNGLVYAFHITNWLKSESKSVFFGKTASVITEQLSVDIDTIEDFELAEYLYEKNNETNI